MVRIQTNLNGLIAAHQLGIHNTLLTQALERLSSGYRINRAADDPSGLVIADKYRSQIRGLQQASKNLTQATSFIQTAEDGFSRIVELLFDIRDLALESGNSTLSTSDRLVNQSEVDQLLAEIDRLATAVRFNGMKLLNGAFASTAPKGKVPAPYGGGPFFGSVVFQVGAYEGSNVRTYIATQTAEALGVNVVRVDTVTKATLSAARATSAIAKVLVGRSRLSGFERRLESASTLAESQITQLEAAEGAIRDADVAAEIVNFTKQQILVQAATAMLAQANLLAQDVLSLLRTSSS